MYHKKSLLDYEGWIARNVYRMLQRTQEDGEEDWGRKNTKCAV
jgi:hypothetical protein